MKKYKTLSCLCLQIDIRIATLLIAVITFLFHIFNLEAVVHYNISDPLRLFVAVTHVLFALSAVGAIVAIFIRSHYAVAPFLFMLVFTTVAITASCIYSLTRSIFLLLNNASHDKEVPTISNVHVLFFFAGVPFLLWCILVVRRCYLHFKAQEVDLDKAVLEQQSVQECQAVKSESS